MLLAFVWPESETYSVDGVPFRTWVVERNDFAIKDPIAALGTNAVPPLIRILKSPDELTLVYRMRERIWKLMPQSMQRRFPNWRPQPVWQLKRNAYFALRFLGPEAKAALPDVVRLGRADTNSMVRATALNAALSIAPESPLTFDFWKEDWERTNYYSRHDLCIYLQHANYPLTAAVPYLLAEITNNISKPPVNELEAFQHMGKAAGPAVPFIIKVLGDGTGTFSGNMMALLGELELGTNATEAGQPLAELLGRPNQNPRAAVSAMLALACIGTNARAALPGILPWTTNADTDVRMFALYAQARIEGNADLALPILIAVLEKKLPRGKGLHVPIIMRQDMPEAVTSGTGAALILLGRLGPTARPALPAIEAYLSDPNPHLRLTAARSVSEIGGDTSRSLPVLLEFLNSCPAPTPSQSGLMGAGGADYFNLVYAIETLEDMGPAAKPAIPALERVRTFSAEVRRAVNAALKNIGPDKN